MLYYSIVIKTLLMAFDILCILALPSDELTLTAKKNNISLPMGVGMHTNNKAEFNVGDTVELTCNGNIGSNTSTKIEWRRTTAIGDQDIFINVPEVEATQGEVSSLPADCRYTRSSTYIYHVTKDDVMRRNNMTFQCYIAVRNINPIFTTVNPPTFYIDPCKSMSASYIISNNTNL